MEPQAFFDSETGTYWVAITAPDEAMLATYPAGAVTVPLRPSLEHTWDGAAWVLAE